MRALANLVLYVAVAEPQRSWLRGDLEEENRGSRWYLSQVLRSVPPLFASAMRRADALPALLAVLLASAGVWLSADAFWSLVLSLVPLKAGLERRAGFVATGVSLSAVLCFAAGYFSCTVRCASLLAPCAALFTWIALAGMRGVTEGVEKSAAALAAPAALVAGAVVRFRFLRRCS